MRISTFFYILKQGIVNIYRNKMFSLASILTMSASIFLFGLFFAILMNFQNIVESAQDGVAVTVLFEEATEESAILDVQDQIKDRTGVTEVIYVSAEQAWEEYKEDYFGEQEFLAEGFKDNPLANSANLEVYMTDVSTQEELVTFIEGLPNVRKVNKSEVVADTLSSINVLVGYVSIAIIVILLIVSLFLINNTVTIGINIRREEIAIMKYIGAKDSFVRAPFVIEGLLIGIIGAVIPLAILYFSYEQATEYILVNFQLLENILEFLPVIDVYRILLPVGLALGVGIGFVGSFFTIRKHLRV